MENRRTRRVPRSPHRAPSIVASEFISIADFVIRYYSGDVIAIMFVPGFRALGQELHPVVRGKGGVIIPPRERVESEEATYQEQWARLPKQLAYNRWLTLFRLSMYQDEIRTNLFSF
jgi:hypothetical protein